MSEHLVPKSMTMTPKLIFLMCVCLSGILLSACSENVEHKERREERDPMIQRALAKKRTQDMDGARDLFMKALQRKPELARSHLELGLIYDDHFENYVSAIYHYQRYVEMRPDAQKKNIVEELLRSAKISYAATFPHQPSGALAEIRSLKNENKMLRRKVEDLMHQGGRAGSSSPSSSSSSARRSVDRRPVAAPSRPTADTYIVKSGDTLSKISKKVYNNSNRWKVIYDANRGTMASPQSLKVGQTLIIPR